MRYAINELAWIDRDCWGVFEWTVFLATKPERELVQIAERWQAGYFAANADTMRTESYIAVNTVSPAWICTRHFIQEMEL